ncbi:aminoglycoside phosphotransferase [Rhizodiscina lignyota]|uniref:Aminoglycoside phosphotransferase n=1 Tax=Rhizodiscina lignyota TaxID=1504668 RepID=A0A9P4IJS6_9PEZI|nr:aminoglycoside phosphotransferase [Rhizodiscina lignyota]
MAVAAEKGFIQLTDPQEQTIVRTPNDLTVNWLSARLGNVPVSNFTVERVGTGQVSHCYRIDLQYEPDGPGGPHTAILKVPSTNEASRNSSRLLNLYEKEVRFYEEFAPVIGGPVCPCYDASYHEDGTFSLLLADVAPALVGNELEGATYEQAKLAMKELGKLHAPCISNETMKRASWLSGRNVLDQTRMAYMYAEFVDRYKERVKPEHLNVCQKLVDSFDPFVAQQRQSDTIMGIMHGDYRLDNMLFGQEGSSRAFTIVDWQTVAWGPSMNDVSYFLGGALTPEHRRAWTEELLQLYHEGLGPDPPITMEQIKDGVRSQSFFGIVMDIVSPIFVERTERGDEMFMTLIARHCDQVLDLDALSILPPPVELKPLRPTEEDESTHPLGNDHLWQESWYFDFADIHQDFGGYVRTGVDPARNRTWYTALLCGPDRPTIAVVDFKAPLPDEDLKIQTDNYTATHTVEDPLKSFRVTLHGEGEAFDDPSHLLQKNPKGRPVKVALDLVWKTDGTPYQYRIATRYEIPCSISGTVSIDNETFSFANCPGQRDHSWGSRDWWALDWVWSAVHLRDGTHIHGVDLRVPNRPCMYIGYTQGAGKEIGEVSKCMCEEAIAENGLATATKLSIEPEGLVVEMDIMGHGPLRLEADDGRVSMFPRAWGKVRTADGREGVMWAEWNHNLR